MNIDRMVGAYRVAVRLYPKWFRDAFGDDLVLLFAEQLHDERVGRVAARTLLDLLRSLPQRHLESHMPTTPSFVMPVLLSAAALSALVIGIVVGHPATLTVCAIASLGLGALALIAARRARPLTDTRPLTSRWWMVMGAGATLLVALVAITTATGELPSGGWVAAMLAGLLSLILMTTGFVLGVVRLASRNHPPAVVR